MIELIAYGQDPIAANDAVGPQYTLDVSNPGALSLTYEVSKGDDIMGRFSPYSQTFRLPFTNINTDFFGHYYDLNISPLDITSDLVATFNVNLKCICEIRVDGVPIIQGSLQLKNVHLKEDEFEIVVFGTEATLFQDIKDDKLIDLFVNEAGVQNIDYDVSLTPGNIKNSFNLANDVTEGNVGAGIIVFPIADYGHQQPYNFFSYEINPTGLGGLATADHLQPWMLKPSINIDHLFRLIISGSGYTLSDTTFLLSEAWTKLFMTLADDRESLATRGVLGVCAARNSSEWLAEITGGGGNQIIPFDADTGTGYGTPPIPALLYDEGDNYNTSTYEFTAPAAGLYHGEYHLRVDTSLVNYNTGATCKMWVIAGTGSIQGPTFGGSGGIGPGSTVVVDRTLLWSAQLEAGHKVSCHFLVYMSNVGNTTRLHSEASWFSVTSSNLTNGIASLPNNMPDILQTDFVKDLVERFNLCIIGDRDNPKNLTIQPWQDYMDLGGRKDWTDRLDLSKKRTLYPPDKLRKKFIDYRDQEDDTNLNAKFQIVNGYPIGKYSQEFNSDFATGTLKNTSIFSPFQVAPVPRQDNTWETDVPDFLIGRFYGADTAGPISTGKPKLYYHNGLKTLDGGNTFYIGTNSNTTYPLCLPFYNDGDPIEADSPLLMWSFEPLNAWGNVVIGNTPSNQGYFARYYQEFLLSIYDNEARLLECSMLLSPSDIFDFNFNDEIQIENTPFRVLKISNYQPFSDAPCKVQLLKKIDRIASLTLPDSGSDCALNLTGYSANGTAIFTDLTDGTTSTGTELCCNENHLYWDGTDCLWNFGSGGGGGGVNPGGNPNVQDVDGAKAYLSGVGGYNTTKSILALNMNPIQGEFSTTGMNLTSNAPSTAKNFVFYCTTYGAVSSLATPDGLSTQVSSFTLTNNMMCRFVIRALSVQQDSKGTTGSLGSSSFKVWTYIAKNIAGTITTTGSEQTDFAQDDADAGVRTLSVGSAKGRDGFNPNDSFGVAISCVGSADRVIAWHLDCSATFMDITFQATENANLILLEDLGFIETENGDNLEQE